MSGIIGFIFERIRDRRMTEHADRKEHFQMIRVEVLERMIEKLGSYRDGINRNVSGWEVPIRLRRSEPTVSKLFETLQSHFPAVKARWDDFERKMESFGEESTALYRSVEDLLLKECNPSLQRLEKLADRRLSQYVCNDFYSLLINPKKEKDLTDVIAVRSSGEKWLIDYPQGNFPLDGDDRESLDAAEQIRASLQSIANSEHLRKQACQLARNHATLLEDSEQLESMIRDAMTRSKLEGKCKYCP